MKKSTDFLRKRPKLCKKRSKFIFLTNFISPRIVVKQGIACCCSSITDENEEIIDGIITGHAYVVVETLTLNGGPSAGTNLIKLFNPWGEGEWEHEWADASELWDDYPDLRPVIADDGLFFMTFEDFRECFARITFARNKNHFQELDCFNSTGVNYSRIQSEFSGNNGIQSGQETLGEKTTNYKFVEIEDDIKQENLFTFIKNQDETRELIVSVEQKNIRSNSENPVSLGFFIVENDATESPFGDIHSFVADCGKFRPGCVCRRMKGLSSGEYKLVVRGFKKNAECGFVIRIFEQICELPDTKVMSKSVMKSCLSRKKLKAENGDSVVIGCHKGGCEAAFLEKHETL